MYNLDAACSVPQVLGEQEKRQGGRRLLWRALHQGAFIASGLGKKEEEDARDSRFDFRCAGSPFGSWSDVLLAMFQCVSAWGFF